MAGQKVAGIGNKSYSKYIETLQVRLQEKATPKTKEWWEAYMKQIIPFRGVKMPIIRSVLHAWYTAEEIAAHFGLKAQKDLALKLFQEEYAEDKLAGILFLQEILLPADAVEWRKDIPRFAMLFTQNWIYDWNTCDWFCVKVLGPLIRKEGVACAEAIAEWKTAENLWQARCSVVAFVAVASNRDYYSMIQGACEVLINREERFAKTSVGWILRDISTHDKHFVREFIESNLRHFSRESLKNATKYFDKNEKLHYLQQLKSAYKTPGVNL